MFELKCIRKSGTGARQFHLTPCASLHSAVCVHVYVCFGMFSDVSIHFSCVSERRRTKSVYASLCECCARLRCCKIEEDVSVFVKWVEPKNIIYFDFSLSAPVECWIRKFTWKWCIMMMTSSIKIVCFICNGNTLARSHTLISNLWHAKFNMFAEYVPLNGA